MSNDIWNTAKEYVEHQRVTKMTVGEMLKEFHETYRSPRNKTYGAEPELEFLAINLIEEEFEETYTAIGPTNVLKELADLVYVAYGYADRWGWDLDEAVRRVHISNMSKLDPVTGKPILREDGKILKGSAYKEPDLRGLV